MARGALLLAVGLLGGNAWAQDEHLAYKVVEVITGCLEDLEPELVPDELTEEAVDLLVRNPRQAAALCRQAALHARRLAWDDAAATARALDAIWTVVVRLEATAPGTATTLEATGEVLLARARSQRQTGGTEAPDLYRRAAEALHEAFLEDPGDGTTAVRSLDVLHELAELPKVDLEEICDTAENRGLQIRERFPESRDVLRAAAASDVLQARRIARKERSRARQLLERATDSLAPLLEGVRPEPPAVADLVEAGTDEPVLDPAGVGVGDPEEDPHLALATVHNAAVAVDQRHRIGLGLEPITVTWTLGQEHLFFDYPWSRDWVPVQLLPPEAREDPRLEPLFSRYLPAVKLVQLDERREVARVLLVFEFDHTEVVRIQGLLAQGDNPKGLAQNELETMLKRLRRAKGPRRVSRQDFSPQIDDSTWYRVAGKTGSGDPVTVEAYVWRSQPLMMSFAINVLDYSGEKGADPIMTMVLRSFRCDAE